MTMLYPQAAARRGGVRMEFAESLDKGVTGVMASVLGLLTGSGAMAASKASIVAGSCAVTCSTSAVISRPMLRHAPGRVRRSCRCRLSHPSDPRTAWTDAALPGHWCGPGRRRRFYRRTLAGEVNACSEHWDRTESAICHVSADDGANYDRWIKQWRQTGTPVLCRSPCRSAA